MPPRSLCDYGNKFKDCHADHIQMNQRKPRPAASVVCANGCCTARITRLDTINKEFKTKSFLDITLCRMEWLFLGLSQGEVGVGVGVDILRPEAELELESPEIRRLRSPIHRYVGTYTYTKKWNFDTRFFPRSLMTHKSCIIKQFTHDRYVGMCLH